MNPDTMASIEENSKLLLTRYKEKSARTKFVRTLEETLGHELEKTHELHSLYSSRFANVRYLNYDFFRDHDEFVRYQEIDERYFVTGRLNFGFISHRWLTPVHPDPNGVQFRQIKERLSNLDRAGRLETAIWYDYSCIPQRDESGERSREEEAEFAEALKIMPFLATFSHSYTFFDSEYLDRTWCLAEWISATRISPLADPLSVPFGNAIKFRQLAVVVAFLCAPQEIEEMIVKGDDHYLIGVLNSLLIKTFRSSNATFQSDRLYIFEVMHRFFWHHIRMLGLRTEIMIGMLSLAQYKDDILLWIFKQFLFITEDPDLSWTKEVLLHMDTMILQDADLFDDIKFHNNEITVISRSRLGDPS